MLHAEVTGAGPRVVLLHGFTQTARSWSPLLPHLPGRELVAVDLPGHGGSADARLDLRGTADALAGTWGPADWVGYSMGGRVALRVALDHPGAVRRLVVIGATAGIDDVAERDARRRADEALAERVEELGTAAFVDEWLRGPLFATLDAAAAGRDDRLRNPPAGLAASLRSSGTATMDPPWWDELARLGAAGIPVAVVVGEHDARFTAIGTRLVASIGASAALHVIPGAGHACHLEAPRAVAALVATHLR